MRAERSNPPRPGIAKKTSADESLINTEVLAYNFSGVNSMKRINSVFLILILVVVSLCGTVAWSQTARWPEQKANSWYAQQPWLVGSNYVPKSAINQLEMWQEATFDPAEIDTEFDWAQAKNMKTMRGFLHALLWQQDAA